jgi:hypothetical protein
MGTKRKPGYKPKCLDEAQVQRAISDAKKRAGTGWKLLGPALQRALVAQEALRMLLCQIDPEFKQARQLVQDIVITFQFEQEAGGAA